VCPPTIFSGVAFTTVEGVAEAVIETVADVCGVTIDADADLFEVSIYLSLSIYLSMYIYLCMCINE